LTGAGGGGAVETGTGAAAGVAAATAVAAVATAALAIGLSGRRSTPGPLARPTSRTVSLKAASEQAGSAAGAVDEDDSDDESDDEDGDDALSSIYEDETDDPYFEDGEAENVVEARCVARFLPGSPQKFRRVLWQIRGRSYREALMLLEFLPWRQCKPVLTALQSAAANAQNHFNMDKSRLFVHRCKATKGPFSKRMRPVSKGQAHAYMKKTTHVTIYVREMSDDQLEKF